MCLEFNVQNLFSWQWLCLDLDKDWCLRKVELKIARTHIEQITAKAAIHSGGNVMMTWWQQNFKQITMCLKPLWSKINLLQSTRTCFPWMYWVLPWEFSCPKGGIIRLGIDRWSNLIGQDRDSCHLGKLSTILQHFTHNKTQWPTAARWCQFVL